MKKKTTTTADLARNFTVRLTDSEREDIEALISRKEARGLTLTGAARAALLIGMKALKADPTLALEVPALAGRRRKTA